MTTTMQKTLGIKLLLLCLRPSFGFVQPCGTVISFRKFNANKAHQNDDTRTDIRHLLTQRATQSFMFLCDNVRDPHSVKWMEDFLGAHNSLNYHGTGAAYVTSWDGPLMAMMHAPKDVVVVSAKRRGRGHGGWSKDNPFLEERFVEFEIDIDPVSLVSRILSVREQVANEWKLDCQVLARENQFPLGLETIQQKLPALSVASSPLRHDNIDLLINLSTQASIHRLLRQNEDDNRDHARLLNVYSQHATDYFDGDQPPNRANAFLRLLGNDSCVLDQILEGRAVVWQEWQEIMSHIPVEHSCTIRKDLLTLQMARWGSSTLLGEEGFQ